MVEACGVAWHEKALGQFFCDGLARQIVDMLLAQVADGGGRIDCGEEITDITHRDGRFHVTTASRTHSAPNLVVATGGPSIPKMGATGFAYELARMFDVSNASFPLQSPSIPEN